jgi:hypothetical protein
VFVECGECLWSLVFVECGECLWSLVFVECCECLWSVVSVCGHLCLWSVNKRTVDCGQQHMWRSTDRSDTALHMPEIKPVFFDTLL